MLNIWKPWLWDVSPTRLRPRICDGHDYETSVMDIRDIERCIFCIEAVSSIIPISSLTSLLNRSYDQVFGLQCFCWIRIRSLNFCGFGSCYSNRILDKKRRVQNRQHVMSIHLVHYTIYVWFLQVAKEAKRPNQPPSSPDLIILDWKYSKNVFKTTQRSNLRTALYLLEALW